MNQNLALAISEHIFSLSPRNIRSHSSNMLKIWFDNATSICTINSIHNDVIIIKFFSWGYTGVTLQVNLKLSMTE